MGTSTIENIVELKGVSKIYKSKYRKTYTLKNISFVIQKGNFVAINGKSGSGKSTLLNMISGIDRPTRGEIIIGGKKIHLLNEGELTRWRGRNIGIVFQFFQLLPSLSILENVILPMDFCHTGGSASHRRDRAAFLLERVGLKDHLYKLPYSLSGGEQQRAAIARALVNKPPVLLADEPTGNLDSENSEMIFNLFLDLQKKGQTIIMVTHETSLTDRLCCQINILDGQIVE